MGTVRVFNHYIHASVLWLALVQASILIFSVYLAFMMAPAVDLGQVASSAWQVTSKVGAMALMFSAVTLVWMAAMGLYQPHLREGIYGLFRRTAGAFFFTTAAMGALFVLFPGIFEWHGVYVLAFLMAFMMVFASHYAFYMLVDREQLKRNVLVYGAGQRAETILGSMRRASDRRGFRFTGFVHVEGSEDKVAAKDLVRLEGSLLDYIRDRQINQVVIAVDDRRAGLPISELLECKLQGIEVVDAANFFEREAGKIMLDFITPGWMVFNDGFTDGIWTRHAKRLIDIIASFALLMFTWPIMLATCIAIWMEEGFGASVIYRQIRVGLNGKHFQVMKFRSMRIDAEKAGQAQWATKDDDRITRVGRFIRKTRIDELPQVINVLAGDMAFIGPRPERPQFVEQLDVEVPHYAARHHVKPGITGWAQLCYPYGSSVHDAAQKLQFDLYYVKNHSLFLDFVIMIATVEVVLFGKGAQ
jgi:sugar transferase (PEP-CTERM system associated)